MIELQKLIQPVSPENPSGELLRYTPVYDAIRSARRADDANLPQGIWQTKLKKADWEEVRNICLDALQTRSKDLQIGAWLLESCIHLEGFAGVADGMRVLTALCENFWETLYPPIDADDPEYRYGPVVWIDEKLTQTLKLVPITKPKAVEDVSYTWGDWEAAQYQTKVAAREKSSSKKSSGDSAGALQGKLTSSISLTPDEFYLDLNQQLSDALLEVDRFELLLMTFDKKQEAALHQMKEMLEAIHYFIREVLSARGTDVRIKPSIESKGMVGIPPPESEMEINEQREYSSSGPVRSRAQAYQMLAEAADYLMKTEPHSPAPYLVRRAVAWGGMTLGELLQQVLRNPSELGELYRLLGLDEALPKHKKGE
jgi:type VI secretion system protein ImpA